MSGAVDSAIDWFLGLVKGDFNEDPSASQIVVGAVISAIPIVGEIWDVRDIIANVCKLCKKPDDTWGWIFLVISLLALIPILGGVLKGAFGLAMKAIRKGGKHADEAVQSMLAVMRGAGYGDPVKYLKNLNWADLTKQVSQHFDNVMDSLLHGIAEVRHRWVFKKLAPDDVVKKLELVYKELLKLKAAGKDQIPKAMQTLREQVDELLAKAKPEVAKGQPGAQTVIKHSDRPLLRSEYEVRDALLAKEVNAMKAAGKGEHEIALKAIAARKELQKDIRQQSDPDLMEVIAARRNRDRYDHPDGPDFKYNAQTGMWDYLERDKKTRSLVRKSKTDAQVTEGAMRSGGDDIPWDKVLEYNRAKVGGNEATAKRLLDAIDKSVNKSQ